MRTIDSRGTLCPRPVLDIAKAARQAKSGDVLELLATDPASYIDVPAWAQMKGHVVHTEEAYEDNEWCMKFVVTIRG